MWRDVGKQHFEAQNASMLKTRNVAMPDLLAQRELLSMENPSLNKGFILSGTMVIGIGKLIQMSLISEGCI